MYDVKSHSDLTQWIEFKQLFSSNKVDGIVFTSASSARAFFEIMLGDTNEDTLRENLEKTTVVAIGPFTADELKKFRINPIIADVHTVPGAVETIKNCLC
ncbi:hypothetical protein DYY67_1003 [Candidatus Nitrosotalea sp. TS]|nr:hypothetical protein [Candidatus Nitrosotalea sp. TS]